MYFKRRAINLDERVDHLARLIECSQYDRVARDVHLFVEFQPPILVASAIERRQVFVFAATCVMQLAVVVASLHTSLVVTHASFHVRQDVVECFQR